MTKKEAMLILKNASLLIHISLRGTKKVRYWSKGCGDARGLPLTKTEAVATVVLTKKLLSWSYNSRGNTLTFWEKGRRDQ